MPKAAGQEGWAPMKRDRRPEDVSMKVRVWFSLLLVLLSVAAAAQRPPSDLHLHGDHWTAWNPPVPPADAQVYVVEQADTLWTLAQRFYGDPYLWPQIWEQNQYVLDAHWIYPGDPLIIPGAQAAASDPTGVAGPPLDSGEAAAGEAGAAGEEDPFASSIDGSGPAASSRSVVSGSDGPIPLGYASDIYCTGFIAGLDEAFAYSIASSEYEFLTPSLQPGVGTTIAGAFGKAETEKVGLAVGDIAYLDGGRADGLSPGELLTAVVPGVKVSHPRSNDTIGRFYRYVGRLRVLSAQESTSIAEVVLACDPVPVGAQLKVFEPEPVPLRRLTPMRPVNFPATADEVEGGASIVFSKDQILTLGRGHLVFVDRGEDDDVAPGDVFTVYRRAKRGFPPIVLGEVGILSVHRSTALARILESRYTVYIGDALLPK